MENTPTSSLASLPCRQQVNLTIGGIGRDRDYYENACWKIERNPVNRLEAPSNQAVWKLIKTAVRVNDLIVANSAIMA
ncbi:hypothetical protein H4R33_006469, partial [Dimargaris cristalligena]